MRSALVLLTIHSFNVPLFVRDSKGSKGGSGSGSSKGGKSSSVKVREHSMVSCCMYLRSPQPSSNIYHFPSLWFTRTPLSLCSRSKECAPVESLCDAFMAGAKGGKAGGESGESTGGKSGKAEPESVETDNVGTGKASKAPTISCIPTEVVEVMTANPTVATTPAPMSPAPIESAITPAPVPETPAPVTPMPVTPAPVTPMPQTPAPATPMPETPAPVTPEVVTFAPTLLITPEPSPFSTEGASVGSTPTVGTEATSLPLSSDPRLLPTR